MNRRWFLRRLGALLASLVGGRWLLHAGAAAASVEPGATHKRYGMGIQVDKCIGCGLCMKACKTENDVPQEPFFFRTWVERYAIKSDGEVLVSSIGTYRDGAFEGVAEKDIVRSFFVPKLCNQCEHPPCVQVCPVRATFQTAEGVVLVDEQRCIGCRYCIQACPYGARYLHPVKKTADKCTFCYHRVSRGLLPACVEVCPTQARVFGDLHSAASPLTRLKRMSKIHVLKAHLNTEPKVFYTDLDGEVR
jgi:Fe-S-cluster-containing dehydrogenase component